MPSPLRRACFVVAETKTQKGLAHYLEHMLFMGSTKYPDENEYDSFISQRGGSSNAFTECEYTLYYFDVLPQHMEKVTELAICRPVVIGSLGVAISMLAMYELWLGSCRKQIPGTGIPDTTVVFEPTWLVIRLLPPFFYFPTYLLDVGRFQYDCSIFVQARQIWIANTLIAAQE